MSAPNDAVEVRQEVAAQAEVPRVSLVQILQDSVELLALIQKETVLLKRQKMLDVKALHDRKVALIRRLEIQKELAMRNPELLEQDGSVSRGQLQEIQATLEAAIRENFLEVAKAREVNQRVAKIVSESMGQHRQRATAYGADGRGVAEHVPASRAYASVAVNQVI